MGQICPIKLVIIRYPHKNLKRVYQIFLTLKPLYTETNGWILFLDSEDSMASGNFLNLLSKGIGLGFLLTITLMGIIVWKQYVIVNQ